MLLGTWYTVTHCWYKWNKECSKSQAKKYYTYLIYAGFEHSVCNESLLTFCIIKYKKICFVNLNGNELMKRQFSRWLVCLRDYLRYIHLIYTSVYLYLSIYIYKIHIYIYIYMSTIRLRYCETLTDFSFFSPMKKIDINAHLLGTG